MLPVLFRDLISTYNNTPDRPSSSEEKPRSERASSVPVSNYHLFYDKALMPVGKCPLEMDSKYLFRLTSYLFSPSS